MTTKNGKQRMRAPVATSPCASAGICPDCRSGTLFLDLSRDGSIEMLCDVCTLFAPTLGSPTAAAPAEPEVDLPSAVRLLRPAERAVFRIVRDNPGLLPLAIMSEIEKRTNDIASRDTVNHCLARLRRVGVVHRRADGWAVCPKGGAE